MPPRTPFRARRLNPYVGWGLIAAVLTLCAGGLIGFYLTGLEGWQAYFIAVNIVAFLLYGYDKLAAQRAGPRIPELVLITLVLVLGFIGTEAGRRLFRHKTTDLPFRKMYWGAVGIEVILLLTYALAVQKR